MSFLASVRASAASRMALRPTYTSISAFHNSPRGLSLNESDRNRDNLDEVYEAEKHDQLRATKEGKAEWKNELASNSEASIKADRDDLHNGVDTKTLQDRTKDLPNKKGKGQQS